MNRYSIVAVSGEEPVNVTQLKLQLSIDSDEWDQLLEGYISAARQSAEKYTGVQLIQKRVKQYFDNFPTGGEAIELSFAPVREVKTIQYIDSDGNTQTWGSSNYIVDNTDGYVPRITEAVGQSYPGAREQANAVWITYDVGPKSVSDVDPLAVQSVLLLASHSFNHREDTVQKMPTKAEYLMDKIKREWL